MRERSNACAVGRGSRMRVTGFAAVHRRVAARQTSMESTPLPDISLEVVEDTSRPGDGCASILLRGVTELPTDAAYSISLAPGQPAATWPAGTRKPTEIRRTSAGVELVIAADLADRLAPGTRVAVEIPTLELRQELAWPLLQRRSKLLVRGHDARDEEVAIGTASEPNPALAADFCEVPFVERPAPEVALQEAQEKLSTIVAKILNIEAADTVAAQNGLRRLKEIELPRGATPDRIGSRVAMSLDFGATMPKAIEEAEAVDAMPPFKGPRILKTQFRREERSTSKANTEPDVPEKPLTSVCTSALDSPEHPPEPYQPAPVSVDRVSRRISFAAFGLAALAAFSALVGSLFGAKHDRELIAVNVASAQTAPGGSTRAKGSLSDVFSIPSASPAGKTRKGVDLDGALSLADHHLQGAGAGDRAEGEYWLRHALSVVLGDDRIKWALTQLGSAYATGAPAGNVDYGKSRLLWEMAGQLGDPRALCFLGALHEYGLGIPADNPSALAWYARAKQAGGCPAVDEALARVAR